MKVGESLREKRKNTSLGNLPEVLTAQDIADYIGISRRRVYELFQLKPDFGGIPNFELGRSKRVIKNDFVKWIEDKKNEKAS